MKLQLVALLLGALAGSCCLADDIPDETSPPTTSPSTKPAISTSTSTSTSTTTTTSTTTSTTTTTTTTTPKPTKNCPASISNLCQCPGDKKLICEDVALKVIPQLSKTEYNKFYFRNSSIESLDFTLLPLAIEVLDVSYNNIIEAKITPPKKDFDKLKSLNFSFTNLGSLRLSTLYKFPALETLDLTQSKLKIIYEDSFNNSTKLKFLNLTGMQLSHHLGDKQFALNKKLELLNLSNSSLVEIPFALRSTSSIKTLILNANMMTSLRQSDFINRTNLVNLEIKYCPYLTSVDELAFSELYNLRNLTLSDNKKLRHFSRDAFKPTSDSSNRLYNLDMIDLRSNNLSSLADLTRSPWLTFERIYLENNPWNCDCELKWIEEIPVNGRGLLHCRSPKKYKDMQISVFFQTFDCQASNESSYHHIIVSLFILFLLGLGVAIFLQKGDYFRRLLWKDQYGSIYYTKARFPTTETL